MLRELLPKLSVILSKSNNFLFKHNGILTKYAISFHRGWVMIGFGDFIQESMYQILLKEADLFVENFGDNISCFERTLELVKLDISFEDDEGVCFFVFL